MSDVAEAGWRSTHHELASTFRRSLPMQVCRPADLPDDAPAPLLWVHDGPAYAAEAGLLDWVTSRVADGSIPMLRLALAGVHRRYQWYSASPRYLQTFSMGLDQLAGRYAVRLPVVVMGASLGGLTALLAGLRDERVGGVFAQSGSFFTPETDAQEAHFIHFDRITTAVGNLMQWQQAQPICVGMTCGRTEENLDNNRLMATALSGLGIDPHADLAEVDGDHDYASWRAALDPALPRLLYRVWG